MVVLCSHSSSLQSRISRLTIYIELMKLDQFQEVWIMDHYDKRFWCQLTWQAYCIVVDLQGPIPLLSNNIITK